MRLWRSASPSSRTDEAPDLASERTSLMRRVAVVAVAQTKHERHIAEPEGMVIDHHTNRNMPAFVASR